MYKGGHYSKYCTVFTMYLFLEDLTGEGFFQREFLLMEDRDPGNA
jgi:hypothetical protein